MTQETIQIKIRRNPKFAELTSKRTRFAITLSLIVLIPYYTFMMIAALAPKLLATPLTEGGIITVGWPIGVCIIVGSWLLTGVYVSRANGEFDSLTQQILKEAQK